MNTVEKYRFIIDHPKLNPEGADGLCVHFDIDCQMVCPETGRVEDYEFMNTKEEIWVELMVPEFEVYYQKWMVTHDYECDGSGGTWDEVVDSVYQKVLQKYGDYTPEELAQSFFERFGLSPDELVVPEAWVVTDDMNLEPVNDLFCDGISRAGLGEVDRQQAEYAAQKVLELEKVLERTGLSDVERAKVYFLIEKEQRDVESRLITIRTNMEYAW